MVPCGEYLDRCKSCTIEEIFDVMQENCMSDWGEEEKNRSAKPGEEVEAWPMVAAEALACRTVEAA